MGLAAPALAQAPSASEAQVAWRLLDYVAVDYAGAVADGQVTNPAEYGEMIEFGGQIRTRLDALPPNPAKAGPGRDAEARPAARELDMFYSFAGRPKVLQARHDSMTAAARHEARHVFRLPEIKHVELQKNMSSPEPCL